MIHIFYAYTNERSTALLSSHIEWNVLLTQHLSLLRQIATNTRLAINNEFKLMKIIETSVDNKAVLVAFGIAYSILFVL